MAKIIFENGNVYYTSLSKFDEALFYAKLAKKPDQGISARQMKASRERSSSAGKEEVENEEKN